MIWEFPTRPGTQDVVRGRLDGRLVLENDTRPGGGLRYVLRDHLGSTPVTAEKFKALHAMLRHPSESCRPARGFGQSADFGGCDVHTRKFTTKERDPESGLDYFGARYYDSVAGRFISPDEPLLDQESSEPQSWNLYAYVRNDPMSNVDSTGGSCVDSKGNVVPDEKGNGSIGDNGDGRGCSQVGVKQSGEAERERGDDIEPDPVEVEDEKGSFRDLLLVSNLPHYVPDDRPLTRRSRLILASAYAQTVTRLDCLGYPIAEGTAGYGLFRAGQPQSGSKPFTLAGSSKGTSPISRSLRRFKFKSPWAITYSGRGAWNRTGFSVGQDHQRRGCSDTLRPFSWDSGAGCDRSEHRLLPVSVKAVQMLWLFPIALLAVCALIVIFILLTAIYDHVKLSRRTGGMSRSEFVESLAEEGVPTVLGDAIYDYYRKLTGVKTFRVHPDDDLGEIYHSYAEEVEEAIDDIARALDLELKDLSVLRRRRTPVLTVRDLAKWLNWARKKGAQEQERPQDLALEDDSWVPSLWPYG